MNITGYGLNNIYNNTNQKVKKQNVKESETKPKENEFKNTKDYMEYLMKEYDCITKYNVSISEKALRKAINNPACRIELERNLDAIGEVYEDIIKNKEKQGSKVLFISHSIDDVGEYPDSCDKTTGGTWLISTNDPKVKSPYSSNKIAINNKNKTKKKNPTEELMRKRIEEKREENKKAKKEEEQELKEKLIEKNRKQYIENMNRLKNTEGINNVSVDFKS